jgi:hypothetical protein
MSRIKSNFSAMRASREAGDAHVKLLVTDPAQRGSKWKEIETNIESERHRKTNKSSNVGKRPQAAYAVVR